MLQCVIQLDLNTDRVISRVTEVMGEPLEVSGEEVHDDNQISFIANIGTNRDEIISMLEDSPRVSEVDPLNDTQVLIKKESSGVIPAIKNNNGRLLKVEQVYQKRRRLQILVFNRTDLRNITTQLEELGTLTVDSITTVSTKDSLLSRRQSEVIQAAHQMGYFDWPRKTNAETLAKHFDISHPTMLEHLRKAEKKIIAKQLNGETIEQTIVNPK